MHRTKIKLVIAVDVKHFGVKTSALAGTVLVFGFACVCVCVLQINLNLSSLSFALQDFFSPFLLGKMIASCRNQ